MDAQLNGPDHVDIRPARNQTPEDLNELRTIVEEWIQRASNAVWSFAKKNGAFQRDSRTPDRPSVTTTARCYMALASVDRQLPETYRHEQTTALAGSILRIPLHSTECL